MAENPYIKATTVGDLLAILAYLPPDAYIDLEGCDCYGRLSAVVHDQENNRIALERGEHGWGHEAISVADWIWLRAGVN